MELFSARGLSRDSLRSRGRAILLTASLILVATVAVAFALAAVRMQAAVTAYSGGESAWSRSQVSATFYLLVFSETGNRAHLEEARSHLSVPVGDMEARLAMAGRPIDREAAIAGFLQGRNHPDDVDRMIWLFRYFSNAPYFREAVEVWEQSDPHIIRLQELGDETERWWAGADDARPISEIRAELVAANQELGVLADEFRQRMAEAARVLSTLLAFLSIGGLIVLGLLAAMLGGRLVRTITESARGFRAIFEQTAVGIAQIGPGGEVVDANDALCSTLGYERSRLVGMRYSDLVPGEEHPVDGKVRRRSTDRDGRGHTVERQVVNARGEVFWARVTASRLRFGEAERSHFVVVIEDISEARELTEKLQHQAMHDELTGLMNRRAFGKSIERHIRTARESGTHHGLCFIDLDEFKRVNDTVGHAAGDHLLRQIALRLRESLRQSDTIARLGGDEFAVIFQECSLEESQELAERLLAALEEYEFKWESHRFQVSCSVGLTPITPGTPDADTVLRAADVGCFLAKEGGRNGVYTLREGDQALAQRKAELEWIRRIRRALDEDRLFLDAQPIASSSDEGGNRYEVLVRLRESDGRTVLPDVFLPAMERFGLVARIDRWVVERVCRTLAGHPDRLPDLEACHINLSGKTLDDPGFSDFVIRVIGRYRIPPEKLCFEITETAVIDRMDDVNRFLERVRAKGCSVALDDFGVGQSSFAYLKGLPVDCLKINGTFVENVVQSRADLAVVQAIVDIGKSLGKTVIAESVDSAEVARILRELGADYLQGYHVSRPVPFEAILEGTVTT